MSNDKLFSILDFGSSKLRLGIFKNYLNNSKFISEIDSLDNFEFKSHNEKQKQNLQDLIIKTEKEITSRRSALVCLDVYVHSLRVHCSLKYILYIYVVFIIDVCDSLSISIYTLLYDLYSIKLSFFPSI